MKPDSKILAKSASFLSLVAVALVAAYFRDYGSEFVAQAKAGAHATSELQRAGAVGVWLAAAGAALFTPVRIRMFVLVAIAIIMAVTFDNYSQSFFDADENYLQGAPTTQAQYIPTARWKATKLEATYESVVTDTHKLVGVFARIHKENGEIEIREDHVTSGQVRLPTHGIGRK